MRACIQLAAMAMAWASVAMPLVPTTAQPTAPSRPQVKNAPDFAGLNAEYRRLRARDAPKCCGFTAPIFGRTVSFWLFDRFEPAYEAQNSEQFILEFVPQGETVETWTRMITLQGFRGTGAAPLSTAEMQSRFFGTSRGCQAGHFSKVIASGTLPDGIEYNLSSNGCGSTAAGGYAGAISGRGEQFIVLLMRDAQNAYVLQYAERGEGFAPGGQPMADATVEAAMSRFRTIGFCRNSTAIDDCSIAFADR